MSTNTYGVSNCYRRYLQQGRGTGGCPPPPPICFCRTYLWQGAGHRWLPQASFLPHTSGHLCINNLPQVEP